MVPIVNAEMSHFLIYIELVLVTKKLLSAVYLPGPRGRPSPIDRIQLECRVAPRHNESSRMRRWPSVVA